MFEVNERSVDTSWLVRFRDAREPVARLVCFPFGGGSAAYFARWAWRLDETVDLVAIQYPGRCSRISEPAFTDFDGLVEEATSAIAPLLYSTSVIFFGHSFGALVAFEVAHRLCQRGLPMPAQIFVSAHLAPAMGRKGDYPLSDEGLRDLIVRLGGMTEQAIASEDLMAPILPGLRADLSVLGTWQYKQRIPLPTPITALGGTDDPECPVEQLDAWEQETTGGFARHSFVGGHFYLNDHDDTVLSAVLNSVGLELPRSRPRRIVPAFPHGELRQVSGGTRP